MGYLRVKSTCLPWVTEISGTVGWLDSLDTSGVLLESRLDLVLAPDKLDGPGVTSVAVSTTAASSIAIKNCNN